MRTSWLLAVLNALGHLDPVSVRARRTARTARSRRVLHSAGSCTLQLGYGKRGCGLQQTREAAAGLSVFYRPKNGHRIVPLVCSRPNSGSALAPLTRDFACSLIY